MVALRGAGGSDERHGGVEGSWRFLHVLGLPKELPQSLPQKTEAAIGSDEYGPRQGSTTEVLVNTAENRRTGTNMDNYRPGAAWCGLVRPGERWQGRVNTENWRTPTAHTNRLNETKKKVP